MNKTQHEKTEEQGNVFLTSKLAGDLPCFQSLC